jgi:hypothetical protein
MANIKFVQTKNVQDLKGLRIPGSTKPFEELTINELVQLRPGTTAADSYNINAVSSDITISTSSLLNELAQARGAEAVRGELAANAIRNLRATRVITKVKDLKVKGLPK